MKDQQRVETHSLESMSDEEFMLAWTELGDKVQADRERLREFSAEHQKRERMKQMNLQPGDLELLQGVKTDGIESEESVNNG